MPESEFKVGEVKALVAPLLACRAEDLGEVLVVARSANGKNIGVFTTMCCHEHDEHTHHRNIDLMAEAIQHEAAILHGMGPQHGPEG